MTSSAADVSTASIPNSKFRVRWPWVVLLVFVILAGAAVWGFAKVEKLTPGHAVAGFDVECDFAKFRQILVRTNATAAIVAHGNMKLLEQRTEDVTLDTSRDPRPLLNAIRGKSQVDVDAKRRITVSLNDPYLEAEVLHLRQSASIEVADVHVTTDSIEPAGRLKSYRTTLTARPDGNRTHIELTIDLEVLTSAPRLFGYVADRRVQEAADSGVTGQQEALTAFINEHAGQRLVLPALGQ